MDEHPLRPALAVGADRWAELSPRMREVLLGVFERSPARSAGRDLGRLVDAPWLDELNEDDRVRAAKIVAYVSALQEGARPSKAPLCRRRIVASTLDSLLSPGAPLSLAFEDLPYGDGHVVAGLRRAPSTVVLNRRAIAADLRRLGEGSPVERRVGTCTLVHEVNHLCNPTAVGPTYAAFMDEYRAWMVDFVVFASRLPRAAEGVARCRDVLTDPTYAEVGAVLDHAAERERVEAFMRRFAGIDSLDAVLGGATGDLGSDAPLPDPPGNLDNDATAREAPRA